MVYLILRPRIAPPVPIAVLAILLLIPWPASFAGTVYLRLVDAKERAPLEFWEKELRLPVAQSILRCRIPQTVYADGTAQVYLKYGQEGEESQGKEVAADLTAGDDLDTGSGPPKDKDVESDRKTDVLGGVGIKALVKCDLTAGAHTVLPGGLKFKVSEAGAITPLDPSLVKANEESLLVLCHPVDINLMPGLAETIGLKVLSGGKVVFADALPLSHPAVLRLYLPLSSEGYTVDLGRSGRLHFELDSSGARVKNSSLEPGAAVSVSGFSIAVYRQPIPQEARAKATETKEPELYLFNDRNRTVYAEGERIQISVRAYGTAAGSPGHGDRPGEGSAPGRAVPTRTVTFRLMAGEEKATAGTAPLRPAGRGAFAEIELDTALLRPGQYRLQAESGGTLSNPLPLEIAPVMPATNLKIFSHVKWGESSMDPADMEKLSSLGFNFLSNSVQNYHCCNGVQPGNRLFESLGGEVPVDPSRFQEYQKAHFPPELLEKPLPIAAGMQAMLARQIQFLAVHFPLILYFNVGDEWRDHAEDRYQAMQHLGMHVRHFPNFAGLTYATGDGPTPATSGMVWASAGVASFDVIHDQRMKKLKEAFEQQFGTIEVDTSAQEKLYQVNDKDKEDQAKHGMSWGFRVGEEIKMSIAGPEDKALLWSQWVNDIYPDNFRQLRRYLSPMVPDPIVTTGSTWGFGAGGGMYPGTFYRALDFAINDMHGDFGVCNFNYVTGTDILTMGMEEPARRPWVGCELVDYRVPASGYKLLLEALSRNPAGIGVLNLHQGDWVCAWARSKKASEELSHWTGIARCLGEVFMSLDRQDEIAVVSSYRQEVLAGQSFRALWAAHYIAQKAGYQSRVITDAFCEAHADDLPKRFRALFLFGMTRPLAPRFAQAVAAFQAKGGLVVVDKASEPILPQVSRTPVGAAESSGSPATTLAVLPFAVPGSHGPSNQNDHLEFEEFFSPLIRQFRDTLHGHFLPFFAFESLRKIPMHEINFTGTRSRDNDLEYLTIFNDGKARQRADGTPADGTYSQFLYEGDKAAVTLARAGTLYDIVRRERVRTEAAGTGLRFECDATVYPGSVYLLTDRPIDAIEVQTSPRVLPGALLRLRAAALDAAGKALDGHLPVEFTITDPRGIVRYQICRRTNENIELKIAGNDPPGTWQWSAVDQATGLAAEGVFEVADPPRHPAARPLDGLVYDAEAVHKFLQREIEVILFPEDIPLQAAAETLVTGLNGRGVKATIRILWPSDTRMYPMQWFYRTMEDRETRDGVLSGQLLGKRSPGKNHLGTYRNDSMGNFAFYGQYIGSAPFVYTRDVVLLGRDDIPANPLLDHIHQARMLKRNVSESFPAPGQGLVGYAWGPFECPHDALVLYGRGQDGLEQAIGAVLRLAEAKEPPERPVAPRPSLRDRETGQVFRAMGLAPSDTPATTVRSSRRGAPSLWPPVYPLGIDGATCDAEGRVFIQHSGRDEATLSMVDLRAKEAKRYSVPVEFRPGSAAEFQWFMTEGNGRYWPPRGMAAIAEDLITPVEWGIGRFSRDGQPIWFYDPFPAFHTYEEMRFPRRVRNFAISADRSRALAAFWNVAPDQGGSSFFNRGDVVLLDAAKGTPISTMKSYFGRHIALSANGTRVVVLDLEHPYPGEHNKRKIHNPHEWTGMSLFDETGKELVFVPVDRTAEGVVMDPNARVAVIPFNNARRMVTLVDLATGRATNVRYPRVDTGVAVAPDGSFAVVTYADGCVRKLRPDGGVVYEVHLPVPGIPAVSARGNTVHIVSPDGTVSALDDTGKVQERVDFGKVPVTALQPERRAVPVPVERPVPPSLFDALPAGLRAETIKDPPFQSPIQFDGSQDVAIPVPAARPSETAILGFRYLLKSRDDRLVVSWKLGDEVLTFHFAAHSQPWPAAVPLKPGRAQTVQLTFTAKSGVTLDRGQWFRVRAEDWANVAWVPKPGSTESATAKAPENANAPILMIPNIYGQIGDPRCEQMSYGLKESDVFRLFDRKVYSSTPLYKVVYPLVETWTQDVERNLRGAEIVMEYARPRTLRGVGIWEACGDLPNEAYTLECVDQYKIDPMKKTLDGDWRLVAAVRGNADYYHVHPFPPTKGRVWRLTIVRTPAAVQRLAEVELYEEEASGLFEDGAQSPDAGSGDGTGSME